MLEYIRQNKQGAVGYVLLAIICIPFVAFGIDALFTTTASQKVASVNGEDITPNQLAQEVFFYRNRLASQMGDQFNPEMFTDERLRQPVLDQLVGRTVLNQAADDLGVVVGKQQIDQSIVEQPEFQEDGKFSPDKYQIVLRSAGLTPKTFRDEMTNQALLQQFTSGFTASTIVANTEITSALSLANQTRDISYVLLPLTEAIAAAEVTDEEVKAFYDENIDRFQTDELVAVDYIELKLEDIAVDVTDEELQEAYNAKIAETTRDARKKVAHILIEDTADERIVVIQERITSGEDFAELAKEFSEDVASATQGGDLGYALAGAFPPEFEAAVELLAEGEVSPPVTTEAGVHFIKLVELEETAPPSFEQERDVILADLQRAKAEPIFATQIEELANQTFSSVDLVDPAQVMGLTLQNSGLFTRDGSTTGLFTNSKLVTAAYSDLVLNQKNNSDVIELNPEHVVVVRVSEHKLPEPKSVAEVASTINSELARQKAVAQVQQQADELLMAVDGAQALATKASELGLTAQSVVGVTRTNFGEANRAVVNAAFSAQPEAGGAISSTSLPDGSIAIYSVSNIQNGVVADNDPQLAAVAQMLTVSRGQQDIAAVQAQLTAEADITLN